jgi:hypothetical protein
LNTCVVPDDKIISLAVTEEPDIFNIVLEGTATLYLTATEPSDVVSVVINVPAISSDLSMALTETPDTISINLQTPAELSMALTETPDTISVDLYPEDLEISEWIIRFRRRGRR